jgi:hypothetical protein
LSAARSDRLRDRLDQMREEYMSRLLRGSTLEPAFLSMIANITTVLSTLDEEERPSGPVPSGAATAETDSDGRNIRLLISLGDTETAVSLSPLATIRLAGELLDAAGLRLADALARLRRGA